MDSTLILVVVLQLLGVGVVIAEIILPSGGILTVAALGLFGYALYTAFAGISTTAGVVLTATDIVMIPVMVIIGVKMMARSPVTLRASLSKKDGVQAQSDEMRKYLNARGTAMSTLRPAGMALINGKRLDVVTRGEYVDKDKPVLVVEVSGNRIIVEEQE
ncbi:MAG: serine protease [Chitinivibrionales bacterium]|nr:serine protease [Chitinivibrionales bacterium]